MRARIHRPLGQIHRACRRGFRPFRPMQILRIGLCQSPTAFEQMRACFQGFLFITCSNALPLQCCEWDYKYSCSAVQYSTQLQRHACAVHIPCWRNYGRLKLMVEQKLATNRHIARPLMLLQLFFVRWPSSCTWARLNFVLLLCLAQSWDIYEPIAIVTHCDMPATRPLVWGRSRTKFSEVQGLLWDGKAKGLRKLYFATQSYLLLSWR